MGRSSFVIEKAHPHVLHKKLVSTMKCAVIWDSKTGNTQTLGEALTQDLASVDGIELVYAGPLHTATGSVAISNTALADTDAILFGFWCDKGDCTTEAAQFLSNLTHQQLFLFGTAGFGGSAEYFNQILRRVKSHAPDTVTLLGERMCQGKMGASVRTRYEQMLKADPDNSRVRAMLDNFDKALSHPNSQDIASVISAAHKALELCSSERSSCQ